MACQRLEPQISHSLILWNSMLIQTSHMQGRVHTGRHSRKPTTQSVFPPPRVGAPCARGLILQRVDCQSLTQTKGGEHRRSLPVNQEVFSDEKEASYQIDANTADQEHKRMAFTSNLLFDALHKYQRIISHPGLCT